MRFALLLALSCCTAYFNTVQTCHGADRRAENDRANRILSETGIRGGLIVHIGCGDGRLTAALHRGKGHLVRGFDNTAANVAKAREYIHTLGLYGPVSVDTFAGKRLPLIDNVVNLVVAEDLAAQSTT